MSSRPLSAVVLAAGEGTRMRSALPKPLHLLCGRAMVLHVLDALAELPVERAVVVVGHGAERVTKALQDQAPPDLDLEFVEQHVQRGTGDAALVALTCFPDDDLADGDLVVLPGDTPLLRPPTVAALVRAHRSSDAAATILTTHVEDPTGCDRVVRGKHGAVARVVGDDHCEADEFDITEVATSIYCFKRSVLAPALRRLTPENAEGEYYLTDVIAVLSGAGYPVAALLLDDSIEAAGVNDRAQLAAAEAELRDRINDRWMRRGVTMADPERTYVEVSVELAEDVVLLPGTILEGSTVVRSGACIGPDTRLTDCIVGADAIVEQTVARSVEIGDGARVGPFAVLEAGVIVEAGVVTGPFHRGQED